MPKTVRGRIVYDRKPHLFRYRDVNRIVRVVEPVGIGEIADVYFTMLRATEDLARLGSDALDFVEFRWGKVKLGPGAALLLMSLAVGAFASLGEGAVRQIRNAVLPMIQKAGSILFASSLEPSGSSATGSTSISVPTPEGG